MSEAITKENYFTQLKAIGDIKAKVVQKGKFNYLSWADAVEEITKTDPQWTYEIEFFDGKPYIFDENTGYMVFTKITAFSITKKMWLPVMDFQNKTKKNADMNDINKTIMRCLVKNIAMFGLGIQLYTGEDLPSEDEPTQIKTPKKQIEPTELSKQCEDLIKQIKIADLTALKTLANIIKTSIKNENEKNTLRKAYTQRESELKKIEENEINKM